MVFCHFVLPLSNVCLCKFTYTVHLQNAKAISEPVIAEISYVTLLNAGAILDATGSFVVPFMVAGSLIATGGFLCLPVRRIARWEQKRNEKRRAATNF